MLRSYRKKSIPQLLNLPPGILQAPRANLLFKFGASDHLGGCVERGANVPHVLLRAAFPVVFEFAHDDILKGRNDEHLAFHFQLPRPRQSQPCNASRPLNYTSALTPVSSY